MVFKSNPTFRFHDSRGFESGGVEELERVKAFIEYRCKEKSLEKQLHVIWYEICTVVVKPLLILVGQVLHTRGRQ
jgi:hypothetical protein